MATVSQELATSLAKQNLLGIFNERDATKRLQQMKETYDPNITFSEPSDVVSGFEAVDVIITKLLESNPEYSFRPVGKVWVNHEMVTMEWEFGPEGQSAAVSGNDIMLVNGQGKIEKMYTMIRGLSDVGEV
ncbi:hypothetical protein Q7P37_003733 [Cladosporium fusiforme]